MTLGYLMQPQVHGLLTCTGIFRLYAYASIPRFKGNDIREVLRCPAAVQVYEWLHDVCVTCDSVRQPHERCVKTFRIDNKAINRAGCHPSVDHLVETLHMQQTSARPPACSIQQLLWSKAIGRASQCITAAKPPGRTSLSCFLPRWNKITDRMTQTAPMNMGEHQRNCHPA